MGLKEDIDQNAQDAASIRAWAHGNSATQVTLGSGNVVRSPAKLIADNQAAINNGIVPDGSITTAKLANAAVTGAKIAASVALSGAPTAPTAAVDNNTTQLATTAFVQGQLGTTAPVTGTNAAVTGTSLRTARADHAHAPLVGSVVQHAVVQTRTQNTYSAPISGNGTEITPLNLSITPRKAGNRMLLEWHINGECHQDVVYLVLRNGVPLTDATDASNNRWAGVVAGLHDNNHASTPGTQIVRIIDNNTLATASTYSVTVRASTGTAQTLYLNRTIGSAGSDSNETSLSTATAMEIHQ